ncbi:MAG: DUF4231 domain-containing protein [Myxococcales bacterium]|nr:MAG: DUF4231 domain-containing protein [Myxococcales bacterium]
MIFRQRADQGSKLVQPTDETMKNSIAWQELERSFRYFEKGARGNRAAFLVLRITVLLAGALIPIVALATSAEVVVACLGALIVATEGTAQLTQVHDHWVRYRHTAEALRREAFAFVSGAGPYEKNELGDGQLLAARILDFTLQESAAWEETVLSETRKSRRAGQADAGSLT